jgi:predicted lipid-binding transport protein (Tim44 family)
MSRLQMRMKSIISRTALAAAVVLALAPASADARVGSGSNSGSRGSKTYTAPPSTPTAPGQAAPVARSAQQPGTQAASPSINRAGAAAATPAKRGFGSMLMGGLLGAGLFGLLSGSGLLGGLGGIASIIGLLLQVALIGGIAWLALAYFRNRNKPAMAGSAASLATDANLQRTANNGSGNSTTAPIIAGAVAIGPEDYNAFQRVLGEVQGAYGREDVNALRTMATPEMVDYFSKDLADNAAKGLQNKVSGGTLLQGDLSESWRETDGEYATVAMRYEIVDAMVEKSSGRVVSGSLTSPQQVTELWTFRRGRNGSPQGWRLSAIQQA